MTYIKVWCEYDFNGNCGGNNNEEVFEIDDSLDTEQVEKLLTEYMVAATGIFKEGLDGLYDWQYLEVRKLNG